VVDDEPHLLAEALRPQPGLVAVSGHDKQVRARRRGHDLPLRAAAALGPVTRAAEPERGGVE
jgi:hypothetical protein